MKALELAAKLLAAARAMQEADGERETVDVAIRMSVAMVRGCTSAGLLEVGSDGRLHSTGVSSDLVLRGDQLQRDLREGPSLSAGRQSAAVCSGDLTEEPRWPRWGRAVQQEMGWTSVLSVRLWSNRRGHGTLNLYSAARHAFDVDDQAAAVALAAQVAMAVTGVRRAQHLTCAADHRTVIGQAQGILMERYGLTPEAAFDKDLDVDSLTMVEVVVACEERFGVRIPDEALEGLRTVGDAVDYIAKAGQ